MQQALKADSALNAAENLAMSGLTKLMPTQEKVVNQHQQQSFPGTTEFSNLFHNTANSVEVEALLSFLNPTLNSNFLNLAKTSAFAPKGINSLSSNDVNAEAFSKDEIKPQTILASNEAFKLLQTKPIVAPIMPMLLPGSYGSQVLPMPTKLQTQYPIFQSLSNLYKTEQKGEKSSISLGAETPVYPLNLSNCRTPIKHSRLTMLKKPKKAKRIRTEWSKEDIIVLLQCARVMTECELKNIVRVVYSYTNRLPGKCWGRAAEKKLKRLVQFKSWKTCDKAEVIRQIDLRLKELGASSKILDPKLEALIQMYNVNKASQTRRKDDMTSF